MNRLLLSALLLSATLAAPAATFAAATEKAAPKKHALRGVITRVDADGKARLRMFPERKHMNLQGVIHGAVTLSLIDIALFVTMHRIGTGNTGPSVTLELSTQFVGGGDGSRPLDAVTEIVRETGKLVFVRGIVVQEEDTVASFSGIVRKMLPRD